MARGRAFLAAQSDTERILFLDVDGVLNRGAASGQGLETDKMALLAYIVGTCDPGIVVTSTWRQHPHLMERLLQELHKMGARYLGHTELPSQAEGSRIFIGKSRGLEIAEWLGRERHGKTCLIVILDDDPDMSPVKDHCVATVTETGLTEELAEIVIDRFKGKA